MRLAAQAAAVEHIAFTLDSRRILIATDKGSISLWDAATAEQIRTFGEDIKNVSSVAFSPDGRLIASGHDHRRAAPSSSVDPDRDKSPFLDCSVRIWEADTGTLLHRFPCDYFGPSDVTFSPDGRRVGAIAHGKIRAWSVDSGQQVQTTQLVEGTSPSKLRLFSDGYAALIDNVDLWYYCSPSREK
jgi:WD40 repeat protein